MQRCTDRHTSRIDVCWCPLLPCDLFSHATEQVSLAVTCLSRGVFSVRTTAATPAILKGISGGLLERNLIGPRGAGMPQAVQAGRSGFRIPAEARVVSALSQNCDKRLLALPCLSVRMEHLGCDWTNVHDILYLNIFSKMCRGNSNLIKIRQE